MEDPTIQKVSVKKKTHTSELKRRLDHSLAKKIPIGPSVGGHFLSSREENFAVM